MKKLNFLVFLLLLTSSVFSQNCKNAHVVAAGETLYAISRKYNLSITEIQSLNQGLTSTIKIGQRICLPQSAKVVSNDLEKAVGDTPTPSRVVLKGDGIGGVVLTKDTMAPGKKDNYNIALLLPFSSFKVSNDSLNERSVRLRGVAISMYRGAMMAKSQLANNGVRANILVYDVGNSPENGARAAERLEAAGVDLVIGPLFKDPLVEVAKWVSLRNAHLVVPIKITSKILMLSEHMSKAYPSENSQWYYLASYAKKEFPDATVVGAYAKGIDNEARDAAISGFMAHSNDSLKLFDVSVDALGLNAYVKSLGGKVVVLNMNGDKKKSTSVVTALTGLDVSIINTDGVLSNSKQNGSSSSKGMVMKPMALDYHNLEHLKWIAAYRKNFQSEPDEFSLIMHDILLYYGTGLRMYGTDLNNHLNDVQCEGLLALGFEFFKTGPKCGYENSYINVVDKMNAKWGLKNSSE